MRVICEQHRDGVPDDYVVEVSPLRGEKYEAHYECQGSETPAETLARKLTGAENRGWQVEATSDTEFHAWKLYADGDGTPERPHRKDRYFRIVP